MAAPIPVNPGQLQKIEATDWFRSLEDREREEVRLAFHYATGPNYGTSGHLVWNALTKAAIAISELEFPGS